MADPDWKIDPFLTDLNFQIRIAHPLETGTGYLFPLRLAGTEHWHGDSKSSDAIYLVVMNENELRGLVEVGQSALIRLDATRG